MVAIRRMRPPQRGHASTSATESAVRELFERHGSVANATIPVDRDSGRLRGFGFIEMLPEDAAKAIAALDGADFGGRDLRVNEARERPGR